MKQWLKAHIPDFGWFFVVYLLMALGIRFWNYHEAMYFIYDVGRDAIVLKEMVTQGDLKLIGSTTGLPGVFLGPLWFYVGMWGYVLSGGSPYGIQLWYIAIASVAVPLFWILSHRLLGNTVWAKIAAVALAFLPGGITGTNFVWNVMLSVPLMTGALWSLSYARDSAKYVYVGFFLLALALQSEFAYAVFFVTFGFLAIPWLRGKLEWKTLLVTAMVIGVTLMPQGLFEVVHHFSMTQAILSGMNRTGTTVSQSYLWQHRPAQLWQATSPFFIRNNLAQNWLTAALAIYWAIAALMIVIKGSFRWKLVLMAALLPYILYMFWKGNYGFFFDYYITPHFIPLVLLLVFGMQQSVALFSKTRLTLAPQVLAAFILVWLSYQSYVHINGLILNPHNNAGLKVMEQAVTTLYDWSREDKVVQAVFRIYTPNLSTENYDYLVWWLSKKNQWPHPSTVQQPNDAARYVLFEPDAQLKETRFMPWYTEATQGFTLKRQETIGVLTVETWAK